MEDSRVSCVRDSSVWAPCSVFRCAAPFRLPGTRGRIGAFAISHLASAMEHHRVATRRRGQTSPRRLFLTKPPAELLSHNVP
jgi:hypothetical protein